MVAPQGTAILVTHHNVVYLTKLLNNFYNNNKLELKMV